MFTGRPWTSIASPDEGSNEPDEGGEEEEEEEEEGREEKERRNESALRSAETKTYGSVALGDRAVSDSPRLKKGSYHDCLRPVRFSTSVPDFYFF